jgi:hypothetical protein
MPQQLCEGAQDEIGAPVCQGPNVRRYHATGTFYIEGDPSLEAEKQEFDAWWCDDCVNIARGMGYKVEATNA